MNSNKRYLGSELDLFAMASNWKAYIRRELGQYISGHVLEVGSGIGETTKALLNGHEKSWTCLEPDHKLADRITPSLQKERISRSVVPKVIVGDIDHSACDRKFDTILYIDVLEHIEDDELELQKATQRLAKKGCLVVLAPAYQFLYSPFDAQLGHFRRYHHKRFASISPAGANLLAVRYLDGIGCLASLGNKAILRASQPTEIQILIWDRLMVPLSRVVDAMTAHRIGRSIYVVWQKM